MDIKQQLIKTIEDRESIIAFLKNLDEKQRKSLVPTLKKLAKEYNTFDGKRDTQKIEAVKKACFVCFNKTDVKRVLWDVSNLAVRNDYIEGIIPWYKPKWYNDVINEEIPWNISYGRIMVLYRDGIIEPSDELIASSLSRYLTEWDSSKRENIYNPHYLLQFEETLQDHIWKLFEVPTSINWQDYWRKTFIDFSNDGKINRHRLLKAAINTTDKGFDQPFTGWFMGLLLDLNPSKEEVLKLQDDFFAALNSPYSKVVNTVLKYFKTIANDKNFQHHAFVDNSTMLLNSETKSIVNSTLMILDKIAKFDKSLSDSICQYTMDALLNTDEKIQNRAAKIIHKHGDRSNISGQMPMYQDNLFISTKEILKDYITSEEDIIEEDINEELESVIDDENRMETFHTFDEILFFVNQVVDNNEVYHIDLFLSYMPKLHALVNPNNVSKLEAMFKRAFDMINTHDQWSTQRGQLEYKVAAYLLDYSRLLTQKYPEELQNFTTYTQQKIDNYKKQNNYFQPRLKNLDKTLEERELNGKIYNIHQSLLLQSKSYIKENLRLDLLSMPTHIPCWIAPETLVQRFQEYENIGKKIDTFDYHIAMSRLPFGECSKELESEIGKIQHAEIRNVLYYHFGLLDIENAPIDTPNLWIQSVLAKNKPSDILHIEKITKRRLFHETGIREWECKTATYSYYYNSPETHKCLIIHEPNMSDVQKAKYNILGRIKNLATKKEKDSFYNFIYINRKKQYELYNHDEIKCLYLTPQNPSPFLTQITNANLRISQGKEADAKRKIINILKGLYEIWNRKDFSEPTYLFLGAAFLYSDKTARELAAELWIKANTYDIFNNELLGTILGRLEYREYGTLKRFTDLIASNMYNVSTAHNRALLTVIDKMIAQMDSAPIKNTKKLLEYYNELLHQFPDFQINQETKNMLEKWSETKSLKTILKKINKYT